VRVAAIIDGYLIKIIDGGSRCGSIVPFPFSGGERNDPLWMLSRVVANLQPRG
jgi:hypothetical protein